MENLKRCHVCGELRPYEMFAKQKGLRDGHANQCKPCKNAYDREYRVRVREERNAKKRDYWAMKADAINEKRREAYAQNPEAILQRNKAVRQARRQDPVLYSHDLFYGREYRLRNRERLLPYFRAKWRERTQDPEFTKRKYQAEKAKPGFKDMKKVANHNRYARISRNGGRLTVREWQALCQHYGHKCLACGKRKPLTIDHIVPVSKGGRNDVSNVQPLCLFCNQSKGARTIDYRV